MARLKPKSGVRVYAMLKNTSMFGWLSIFALLSIGVLIVASWFAWERNRKKGRGLPADVEKRKERQTDKAA